MPVLFTSNFDDDSITIFQLLVSDKFLDTQGQLTP